MDLVADGREQPSGGGLRQGRPDRALATLVRRRRAPWRGLSIYLAGALGFEALSGYHRHQQRPNVAELLGTVEEVLEMGACIVAVHVILDGLLPLHVEAHAAGRGQR